MVIPLLWYSLKDTLTNGDFSYECKYLLQRVTSAWFSDLLPCLLFLKINQPKIINMPKGNILG